MVKVKCRKCGNVQTTYGRWVWTCNKCKTKQTIEGSIVEEGTTTNSAPDTQESKTNETPEVSVSQSQQIKPEIQEEKVEFEESQEQEEEYKCPVCGAKVEKYQDCSNCGAQLIWQGDD